MDVVAFIAEQRSIATRQEAAGRLARSTAHEINNILQSLNVHLYFAREALPADSQASADVAEAEKAAAQLQALSHGLRVIGRPADAAAAPVDLAKWLSQATVEWRGRLSGGAALESDLPSLPMANIDPALLTKVLHAVLDNAVQFSGTRDVVIHIDGDVVEAPPAVTSALPWLKGPQFARLSIRNNGTTMTGEVRERACDPYFTTRENQKSAGQGLAFSLRALHSMGGFLHLHETLQGAEVSLFVPLEANAAPPPAVTSPRPLADVLGGNAARLST